MLGASLPRSETYEDDMTSSRTKKGPTVRPDSANVSGERGADLIFIQDWARTKSAKEGAALTGMTPNGFKKVQAGECAISYEKLTFAMKRDPHLAAAYAAHVGLILPGEAEFAGALTQAFNAYQRRTA